MNGAYTDWAWPWWTVMVLVNAGNLAACAFVYVRSLEPRDGRDSVYRKRMRTMGVIFTLVGAYRSVFVSRYLAQMAWFETIANSSLLIRMFAVAAELSFSGLIALGMLRANSDLSENSPSSDGKSNFMLTKSPYVLMISIFVAQFFATGGLIIKSRTLFAIEETLWTIGFLSVLPLAVVQFRRVFAVTDKKTVRQFKMLRGFTKVNLIWCAIYCCYGLFYHLPFENWPAAINQMKTGLPVMKTGAQAIIDAFTIVHESKRYGDWGFGFLLWHSAYFSICVWLSIFFMQAPRRLNSEEID